MLMLDALVATPLNAPISLPYIPPETPCIAADGGIHTALDLQLNCVALVGDMDSIQNEAYIASLKIPQYRYPRDKDHTDTELALSYALKTYGKKIGLIGGSGGRLDHFFSLFLQFQSSKRPVVWITDASCMLFCVGTFTFTAPLETQISIFNCTFQSATFSTEGLHWPFQELAASTMSLSNRTITSHVSIISDSAYYIVFDEMNFHAIEILTHSYA